MNPTISRTGAFPPRRQPAPVPDAQTAYEARACQQVKVLREAIKKLIPHRLCGEGWDLPASEGVSVWTTFGDLKFARAALADTETAA